MAQTEKVVFDQLADISGKGKNASYQRFFFSGVAFWK